MSDHALLVAFGDAATEVNQDRVLRAIGALSAAALPGLRNLHPAFASVLVVCDPLAVDATTFRDAVERTLESAAIEAAPPRPIVEIPVCYEPDFAPDLGEVAARTALGAGEVVRLHSSGEYSVAFLGFTPGFPYLAGLPEALAVPRLATPRKRVPAGSVAIAGRQAGIYPFATPGGWRLIGRTPLDVFRADRSPPALLWPGDRVRFSPITGAEFERLAGSVR